MILLDRVFYPLRLGDVAYLPVGARVLSLDFELFVYICVIWACVCSPSPFVGFNGDEPYFRALVLKNND